MWAEEYISQLSEKIVIYNIYEKLPIKLPSSMQRGNLPISLQLVSGRVVIWTQAVQLRISGPSPSLSTDKQKEIETTNGESTTESCLSRKQSGKLLHYEDATNLVAFGFQEQGQSKVFEGLWIGDSSESRQDVPIPKWQTPIHGSCRYIWDFYK